MRKHRSALIFHVVMLRQLSRTCNYFKMRLPLYICVFTEYTSWCCKIMSWTFQSARLSVIPNLATNSRKLTEVFNSRAPHNGRYVPRMTLASWLLRPSHWSYYDIHRIAETSHAQESPKICQGWRRPRILVLQPHSHKPQSLDLFNHPFISYGLLSA